jgi:hypothetical protein
MVEYVKYQIRKVVTIGDFFYDFRTRWKAMPLGEPSAAWFSDPACQVLF